MEREIPKVIHYCWFGGNPLPELAIKCIESWKKYLPDYEIKQWNEQNFDVHRIAYTDEAYRLKKYAHVSDYARFWILYNYGGVYFDTDVEVIRPLDDLIERGTYMGFECPEGTPDENPEGTVNPGLGMAAVKGHPFFGKVVDYYDHIHFVRWNGRSTGNIGEHVTSLLDYDNKQTDDKGIVDVDGLLIYPTDYFCPKEYQTGEVSITDNTRTIHHYMRSCHSKEGRVQAVKDRIRFIFTRLRGLSFSAPAVLLLFLTLACTTQEPVSEYDRSVREFLNEIEGDVSPLQWWRTAVKINLKLTTDSPVKIWLTAEPNDGIIYDYQETETSGTITLTGPQGYENPLYISVYDHTNVEVIPVSLSGKQEEYVSLTINRSAKSRVKPRNDVHPESLCGNSINGNPRYYEFNVEEMADFHSIMDIVRTDEEAKRMGLNTNYEITSNGPFFITWVTGYGSSQKPRILGYYYHSPETFDDIVYEDICETHKWDYIDGLAKVQYQFDTDITEDGHLFAANEWYDANFDLNDYYGSTFSVNMDRIGDNAYNAQVVYNKYSKHISAYQGIAFELNVPRGRKIGFYLRSDEEPRADQWKRLQNEGIKPYTSQNNFKGTCYSVEEWNVDGGPRSFIYESTAMTWIGMEDNVEDGDNDCNDVVFGLVGDLNVLDPISPMTGNMSFPWTLAFEDVYRGSDYDFNDAVIRLVPNPMDGTCQVTILAAGAPYRMFLHYDGPDGDYILGEIHQLLTGTMSEKCINTQESIASTPFVRTESVPWPFGQSLADDAKRFWVEIQRGTCDDCSDVLSLPDSPGDVMPKAILVAGDWCWPMEGEPIYKTYTGFPSWAKDVTRIRFWEWFKTPVPGTYVSY